MTVANEVTIKSGHVKTGNYTSFVHEAGSKTNETILFLHGSGPGVTSIANWSYALNDCGNDFHCLAPDLYGFAVLRLYGLLTVVRLNSQLSIFDINSLTGGR